MPKNSQYGRWRRTALQVVLWLIFGGTLALAGFVSHRRTSPLGVTLAEPITFGGLKVRLPQGWEREDPADPKPETQPGAQPKARPDAGRQTLVVKERDEEGRQRRELWITQERQTGSKKGPTYYLETAYNLPDSRAEPFSFLGSSGKVITWRGVPHSLFVDLEELADKFPDPGLYACAVLPDGLTVSVQVRGPGAYGPSNQRLIRLVADNLKLSDGPATQASTIGER
jgi:hypothetical protein